MDIIFPLRKENYEYYLYAMLAPANLREVIGVTIAFEWELEQIKHKVTEEMLGYIRFAWWQESLDMLTNNTLDRSQPLLNHLKKLTLQYPELLVPLLSKRWDVQQRTYTARVEGHTCMDTKTSLISDLRNFIHHHDPKSAREWYKQAERILKSAKAKPLNRPRLSLLLRLFF